MRKVQLLLVCLILSAAAFAADKVIKHCLNVSLHVNMLRKH